MNIKKVLIVFFIVFIIIFVNLPVKAMAENLTTIDSNLLLNNELTTQQSVPIDKQDGDKTSKDNDSITNNGENSTSLTEKSSEKSNKSNLTSTNSSNPKSSTLQKSMTTYSTDNNTNNTAANEEKVTYNKTINNGIYQISSALNINMVLDIEGMSTSSGANICLYENKNGKNQKFLVTYLENGYYSIKAVHSSKMLDVSNAGKLNGTNVQQWQSNNTDAQKWIIKDVGNGYYSLISKCNNLYLDVTSGNAKNGTNIQMYKGNGTLSQKFKFVEVAGSNPQKTISNGTYQIISALNNNRVLKVEDAKDYSGANVLLSNNYNNINQKFKITYLGNGYYTIQAVHSGKMLDVSNAGTSNGTNVQQWQNNNTDAQKWVIKNVGNDYYTIISKCNDLCVDVTSGNSNNGTNIQMYKSNGTNSQKFKLKIATEYTPSKTIENGTYQIASALNINKVLDVYDGRKDSGINVLLWANNNGQNQKFEVSYIGSGYYTLKAVHSSKMLDVSNANICNGTNVQQWNSNNTNAQKWIIKDAGNGYYYIISKCNGLYVDVSGGNSSNGTNIQMYEGNQTNSQKFKFIKSTSTRTYNGIDVSQYNGDINWNTVAKSQNFAIIRVGFRGYLRPRIVMDLKFSQNIQGALSANMPVGVYFFSQAITEAEAIEEANWVADNISKYKISYPVILDSEWSNDNHDGRADKLSVSERTKISKAFLETIKNRGYKPMLYASPYWINNYLDMSQLNSYDLWLAHYTGGLDKPSNYSGKYTMWQYTSEGHVDGILTNVDRNICYKQY